MLKKLLYICLACCLIQKCIEIFLRAFEISPIYVIVYSTIVLLLFEIFGVYVLLYRDDVVFKKFMEVNFILACLQILVGIYFAVFTNSALETIKSFMNYSLSNYAVNEEWREIVDYVQSKLHCCGVNGPDDWSLVLQQLNDAQDHAISITFKNGLPLSCFHMTNMNLYLPDEEYQASCLMKIASNFWLISIAFLFIGAIQCIVITMWLSLQ